MHTGVHRFLASELLVNPPSSSTVSKTVLGEQRTVQGRETESEPVGSRTNTVERGVCRLDEVY